MERYKKIGILKVSLAALMIIATLLGAMVLHTMSLAHEDSGYKHGPMPGCFGWEKMDLNKRMCYLNEEQTECTYLIHNHGKWHKTDTFECPVEIESLCEEALPLNGEEEGCGG